MSRGAEVETTVQKLESVGVQRLVLAACVLNLLAIGLMVWSVLDPTPLPVMVVMSIGQVLGTAGLVCYWVAVLAYQWKRKKHSPPAQ